MNRFLHRLGSLQVAYQMAGLCLPWFSTLCVLMMVYGVVGGLFLAPPDVEQGDAFRMIYIHVPSAFLSLMIYGVIFVNSVVYLVWHIKLADITAKCSASVGATYTIIALFSGALWGKPMWGTWWIWDARLTSELILLFLYMGYMGLRNAIREPKRAAKASAILAVIGMVDIPIIHFSVEWWATLHQGATLAKFSKPSIASEMLYPLLAMLGAFILFYVALLCVRVRVEILKRERKTQWVQAGFAAQGSGAA
ncbi:MAG TPA: heme ABC transporter permease [Gammaproteobacteria bacterium]|nr:heme ABC transporter permease [Gammaproteobacteria bacterium]